MSEAIDTNLSEPVTVDNNSATTNAPSARQDWLDIARGLGIIFVMIGHSLLDLPVTIVYIFHMPLFFVISGYLFSGADITPLAFIGKKAKRLIVPYYVLSIPMLIAYDKVNHMDFNPFKRYMGKQHTKDQIFMQLVQIRYSTLWFIACLFWLSLIFYLIVKKTHDNLKIELIISLIFIPVGIAYNHFVGMPLPGNFDIICYVLLFFFAGHACRKSGLFEKEWINKRPLLWFFVFMTVSLLLGFANYSITGRRIDMYCNEYGVIPITYAAAFAGVFAMLCLSRTIKSRVLSYIGRNSILFYAWHQAITFPLATWIMIKGNFFRGSSFQMQLLQELFCIIFSLITLWIPTYLLKKLKFSWVFGL